MICVFVHLILHFQQSESLLREVLDKKFHCAIPEIIVYLKEGIGNETRIDYGTGQLHSFTVHSVELWAWLCVS